MTRKYYHLHWDERPFTTNGERRMHPMQRAAVVRKWREAFRWLAIEAKIPRLEDVEIIATPYAKDRRWRADVGGCSPTVKAAIDGLVDANVMEDDNPDFLKFLGFRAPIIGNGDGLQLEISGFLCETEKKNASHAPKANKQRYNNGRKKAAKNNGSSRRVSDLSEVVDLSKMARPSQRRRG